MLQDRAEKIRRLEGDEEPPGVEVILAGVVHHAKEAASSRGRVGQDLVDLPLLEVVVPAPVDTDDVVHGPVSRGGP